MTYERWGDKVWIKVSGHGNIIICHTHDNFLVLVAVYRSTVDSESP
jgi:hypothetical protein